MPEMSGIDLIKEIQRRSLDITVVFISGYADFKYAQQAIKYGVFDYLLKPVKSEEFCTVFEKIRTRLSCREEEGVTEESYYSKIVKKRL